MTKDQMMSMLVMEASLFEMSHFARLSLTALWSAGLFLLHRHDALL